MSRLSASQSRGQRHHQAAQGSPTFTFSGATIPCSVSHNETGSEMMVGGTSATVAITLIVRPEDITGTVPTDKNSVLFDGVHYRVISVKNPGATANYHFILGNLNR